MKRALLTMIVWCVACSGRGVAGGFEYETAARSVVVVYCHDTSSGGGGVVLSRTAIVTMAHIVGECKTLDVTFFDHTQTIAHVSATDSANDLVMLRPDNTPEILTPATIATGLPEIGATLNFIGHPNGLFWTYSRGYLAYPDERHTVIGSNDINVIQANVDIYAGSSGGGLFDEDGRLIGLAEGQVDRSAIGFFVPASAVCKKALKCKPHKEG